MNDQIDSIIANSYKNFHARGFDYLCLRRSEDLTLKVYLVDGPAADAPEIVNPHDHRYDFRTTCLAGRVTNFLFRPSSRGEVFQQFEYRTPLNGGNGFTWAREARLKAIGRRLYVRGQSYELQAEQFHTIRLDGSQSALLLEQGRDRDGLEFTSTFMRRSAPPDMTGCYERFTADEVVNRLRKLERLVGKDVFAGLMNRAFGGEVEG